MPTILVPSTLPAFSLSDASLNQNKTQHGSTPPLKNMRCSEFSLDQRGFHDLFGVPTWHEARPPAPWMEPGAVEAAEAEGNAEDVGQSCS